MPLNEYEVGFGIVDPSDVEPGWPEQIRASAPYLFPQAAMSARIVYPALVHAFVLRRTALPEAIVYAAEAAELEYKRRLGLLIEVEA